MAAESVDEVRLGASQEHADRRVTEIEDLPVITVPLSSLRAGTFLRQSGTDTSHVHLLAEVADPDELPAILVQQSNLRVVDGMHRIEAARLRGEQSIRARFVNCTDEEAFILAVKSNTLHGLPLSRADRIAGAKRILTWHHDWSNRAVAAATGLSAKTIAGLRGLSPDNELAEEKRLGRDGKRRPVTGAEGRKRAVDYLASHPDASLREVARETDVSIGTVHDIHARLRRGQDPTAVGARRSGGNAVAAAPATAVWSRPDSVPAADVSGTTAHAGAAGAAARRRVGIAPTWSAISGKLAGDPAVKYTEGGREFLRWMGAHVVDPAEWHGFVDSVPAHWAQSVSVIAQSVSDAWRDFADQLRVRQDSAS